MENKKSIRFGIVIFLIFLNIVINSYLYSSFTNPLYLIMIVLNTALIILFYYLVLKNEKSKNKDLKETGQKIITQFLNVKNHQNYKNKTYYSITSYWIDPSTGREYEFESENLDSDPRQLSLSSQDIVVYIDLKNPNNYLMDLNFL